MRGIIGLSFYSLNSQRNRFVATDRARERNYLARVKAPREIYVCMHVGETQSEYIYSEDCIMGVNIYLRTMETTL